jgi:hypothetical protein
MIRVLRLAPLGKDAIKAIRDRKQRPDVTLARVLEPFLVHWALQTCHDAEIGGSVSRRCFAGCMQGPYSRPW